MKHQRFRHSFVEFVPDELEEGVIYVSLTYGTAVHMCACGCGSEVVTPISPTDWTLHFDGESISLDPSIGNWSFECQSHYWVRSNEILWAPKWSQRKIAAGRAHDRENKGRYFAEKGASPDGNAPSQEAETQPGHVQGGFWQKLRQMWR